LVGVQIDEETNRSQVQLQHEKLESSKKMGANQSSKSQLRIAPEFAATQQPPNNNSSNKNSFGKQQLNRLLRKSLPAQARLNGYHNAAFNTTNTNGNSNDTDKCKLNGNNKSDQRSVQRLSSGQQPQQQPVQSNKSIYDHESRNNASLAQNRVFDSNTVTSTELNNQSNNNFNKNYFVTSPLAQSVQQRQERLTSNNQSRRNEEDQDNGFLFRQTKLSHGDANGGEPRGSRPATHMNPYDSHQASKLHEHDQRMSIVRQQQQQLQQSADEQRHNKSIMTTTMGPLSSSHQQARQPLDSSNAHLYNHHHQSSPQRQNHHHHQQQQQRQPQQQQQQSLSTPAGIRSNKSSSNTQQHPSIQQLKSSCSPSSASSTSGSSADSSSELPRQRRNIIDASPLAASSDMPSQPGARPKLDSCNAHSISRGQQQQHLVAMQQHHNRHRRVHSSGEPLSWSKQQQAASHNLHNDNNDHHQQQRFLLMASHLPSQSNGGQQQYQRHQQAAANGFAIDSQHMLTPDHYRQYQYQYPISGATTNYGDEIEQFYSRNLHLLAGGGGGDVLQDSYHHQHMTNHQAPGGHRNVQLYSSNTLGHMSAPLQRRYKCPQQQYQYLNNSSALGQSNQQQFHVQTSSSSASQQQQAFNTGFDDDHSTVFASMSESQPVADIGHLNESAPANYLDQELAKTLYPAPQAYWNINTSSTLKSRSKSLSKSPALRGKQRSRNPLASIFATSSAERGSSKFGANTIHHLSSSKSHHNLQSSISRSASHSNANTTSSSSLKRIRSSPMTAQQTSYEAMRTIDMYLIRQIARSCMVSSV
jgi:hypothetical protein